MSKASDLARLMTSGSTAIHGEAGVTSSGSTGATTNLQQGLCKVWADIDMTGTAAVDDSFNVTSMTDGGTGLPTITIANDFANANYCCAGMGPQGASSNDECLVHFKTTSARSTGSCNFRTVDVYNASSAIDYDPNTVLFFGDLA
jgi:hypothetical protein